MMVQRVLIGRLMRGKDQAERHFNLRVDPVFAETSQGNEQPRSTYREGLCVVGKGGLESWMLPMSS